MRVSVCVSVHVQTCPSFSETSVRAMRASGSVAWPASSRKAWVKCPTLRRHKAQGVTAEGPAQSRAWGAPRPPWSGGGERSAMGGPYCSPTWWSIPALEQVLTTILWKEAWRMSSPALEYGRSTSGMDWAGAEVEAGID